MKIINLIVVLVICFSCGNRNPKSKEIPVEQTSQTILGSWKLVYGETKEGDSTKIKDLANTEFIKIINEDHFAFFNQPKQGEEGFYGGGGTYTLTDQNYREVLQYIGVEALRGHEFSFEVEIKGDTLVQSGIEDVPEAGIKRFVTEKYIRIK